MTSNTAIDSSSEFNSLLDDWNRNQSGSENVSSITRLADILEKETEAYYKMDPDPMDDRHPGRANPTCILGQLMKAMFRHEEFMNKVVGEYIMSSRESEQSPLHTASCRLLLDVLPGLETSVVFQETEGLVARLVYWAETAEEPLRSYATGLLGGAMEIQDVATNFKEHNSRLVPLMLQRLHELRVIQEEEEKNQKKAALTDSDVRHFASFASGMDSSREKATSIDNVEDISENVTLAKDEKSVKLMSTAASSSESTPASGGESLSTTVIPMSPATSCGSLRTSTVSPFQPYHEDGSYRASLKRALSPAYASADSVTKRHRKRKESFGGAFDTDCSNSSWAEMEPLVIGSYSLSPPLTTTMKQRLILQYLTPMGDYQELLSSIFEHRAMDLIFYYISLRENSDVRLAFEALKYLATLLCHKKFAIEFLVRGGLQRLLQVHRPSIAATGVALCVYYLSYFEDVMERVCLLPEHVLSDLVGYVLWLMECSHDSSRCHACMFFSQVFPFRVMLDLFDQRDGLRRLFNVISTLGILNIEESSDDSLNEDVIFAMRQAARHVCGALKKYFEAQLTIKADDVRRSHMRNDGSSPLQETPGYKPLKLTGPVIAENIELLMELLPVRSLWQPELTFHNLGGLQLLVRLVAMAPEWTNYPGKPETIKSALDVLTVLTVSPRSQVALLSNISLPDNLTTPALSVLTGLAEGEILSDAEVQKSALNVLINCVCGPVERLGGGVGRFMGTGSKKKVNMRIGEDVLSRMWNGMRTNNGIMVLLKLLSIKTPITEADTIRALVCKALLGMSRSETVKQILSKLPLFNNGQLQSLMKEPILQDRRQEHVKFCKYASQLLERVSGKQPNTLDASLEDIRKADIVAQTKIIYREKELLQLIHDHLASKGLTETASVLQREAGLPRCTTPPLHHPTSPHIFSPATPKPTRQLSQTTPLHSTSTPIVSASCHSVLVTPSTEHPPVITPTPGPIRFSLHRQSQTSSPSQQKPLVSKSRFQREGGTAYPLRSKSSKQGVGGEYTACLDKIVTEYLRKQHALCRNPVSTCPPMSLFNPHRCPEPQGRRSAPASITSRLMHRAFNPRYGGLDGAKLNRKYIYNRFLPFQTYRDKDDDGFATCCFSADEKYLMLGTFNGDLKLINMTTGEEAGTLTCHTSPIIRMEPSRDGHLLLTSSWGLNQDSALWMMGESLECKYTFDEHFMEFSRLVQDRLVGTKDETAHIYDVATGVQLMTLYDQDKANNYRTNVATFSPTDELVLNDGVLWDLRSRKPLHKFDKFNQYISGVFHPMGQEIIINSEVWDQRTFKLLHTVPALDQCQIKFNHSGDVIFATHMDEEADIGDDYRRKQFSSTLRTFDATDYSSIGTMDLKTRSIFDLCMDKFDSCLAVVEVSKQNSPYADGSTDESICRLYEIGKLRDEEDDVQEEDEEGDGVEEEEDEEDDEEDPSFLDFASLQDSDVNEDQHFILDVDFDKYCTVKQHQSKMTHVPRIISMDQPEDVFWSDPVWWRINILPISQQNITDITFFHLLKSNKGINLCNKLDWNDEDGNDDVAADEERDEEDAVEYSPSSSDDDQDDNDNDDLDDDMLFALV